MSDFHMDEKDANKIYTFTSKQLFILLCNTIKLFITYNSIYNLDATAQGYAINEIFAQLHRNERQEERNRKLC